MYVNIILITIVASALEKEINHRIKVSTLACSIWTGKTDANVLGAAYPCKYGRIRVLSCCLILYNYLDELCDDNYEDNER